MRLSDYEKGLVENRSSLVREKMSDEEIIHQLNFKLSGERINKTEKIRINLNCPSGSSYHHTEKTYSTSDKWENAHFHKGTKEIYFVEKGKILIATKGFLRSIKIHILNSGDAMIINEEQIHNAYAFENTIYKVIKNPTSFVNESIPGKSDWFFAPEWFDKKVKKIDPRNYV